MVRTPYLTHTLEKDREEIIVSSPSGELALVDLDSYPAFIGREADYFDMMAHLAGQMEALTAIAWKAPDQALKFRVLLTGDDSLLEQCRSNRVMVASGNVRSYGRLGLATHERLFDSARHRRHGLLRGGLLPKPARSQVLNVPPGIYSIYVYYHALSAHESWGVGDTGSPAHVDYNVLLRHYAFPPPRVAPVRIRSRFLVGEDEEAERAAAGVITSHARVW